MRANRSGESALLLVDVVDLLTDHKVDYAVIGAFAASVHGAVRASMDADVLLLIGFPQAENLRRAFESAGLHSELTRGDVEDPIPGLLRVTDPYSNRVDMLIGLRGMDSEAFRRLVDVSFQGKTLKFIGREDFIAMKIFAAGPMDLIDAARAISAAGNSLDTELLRRLAKRFGRDASIGLDRLLKPYHKLE